jgi:hypothetical protein
MKIHSIFKNFTINIVKMGKLPKAIYRFFTEVEKSILKFISKNMYKGICIFIYIYIMKYYSAMKKNEIVSFV